MNHSTDRSVEMATVASFKQLLSICHSSIDDVRTGYPIPVGAMHKLRSADLCLFQMSRLCNIFNYLFSPKSEPNENSYENFDPLHLLTELSKAFTRTVSGYISINADCYSKLRRPFPLLVNKIKFEFVFLNLLYCSLRCAESVQCKNAKFTLYITETKNSLVFHLRDNCAIISPEITNGVFSHEDIHLYPDNELNSSIELSLRSAQKGAEELNGKLSYTALKSGNRFDLTLSKTVPISRPKAKSLSYYTPTHALYNEILADILLAIHLNEEEPEQ